MKWKGTRIFPMTTDKLLTKMRKIGADKYSQAGRCRFCGDPGNIEKVRFNMPGGSRHICEVCWQDIIDVVERLEIMPWANRNEDISRRSEMDTRTGEIMPYDEMMKRIAEGENEKFFREVPAQTIRKKTGRNALCPCGSGLKFKKCCAFAKAKP
jgi:hypothetical protein